MQDTLGGEGALRLTVTLCAVKIDSLTTLHKQKEGLFMERVEGGEGKSEPRNLKEQKQSGSFLSSHSSRKPIWTPRGLLGDTVGRKAGGHSDLSMRFSHTECSEKDARFSPGRGFPWCEPRANSS